MINISCNPRGIFLYVIRTKFTDMLLIKSEKGNNEFN
jgi:hypothetical protein